VCETGCLQAAKKKKKKKRSQVKPTSVRLLINLGAARAAQPIKSNPSQNSTLETKLNSLFLRLWHLRFDFQRAQLRASQCVCVCVRKHLIIIFKKAPL